MKIYRRKKSPLPSDKIACFAVRLPKGQSGDGKKEKKEKKSKKIKRSPSIAILPFLCKLASLYTKDTLYRITSCG